MTSARVGAPWVLAATWIVSVVFLSGCQKDPQQLQMNVQKTVRDLLNKDCGVGDSLLANEQMQHLGPAAIPELYAALRLGPSAAERDTISVLAAEDYGRVQALIAAGGFAGVNPASLVDSLIATTSAEYVGMELESYVMGVHQRALNALVAINPPTLEDSLTAIRTEPTLPVPIRLRIEDELSP